MPIYEYRCQKCQRKFQALVGITAQADDGRCPNCSSAEVVKLVSRFARGRDEDARIGELADRMDVAGEPGSFGEARRLARDMGSALDEDASEEMEEMLEDDAAGA